MALAVIVCAGSPHAQTTIRSADIPTGQRYAGKHLYLPTFPHVDTIFTAGCRNELYSIAPDQPARILLQISQALSDPAVQDYWVIGPRTWSDVADRFIRTRNALGLPASYVAIEDIVTGSLDSASALRDALHEGYDRGLRYALLVGDQHSIPVRYAYDRRTDSIPPLEELQICDLYFGEFDGNWDADGDGIYGEPYDDLADLGADVLIGRLPISSAAEFAMWIAKWERYVFARGEISYLNRALGFAADQMRDDQSGAGQAAMIGRVLPPQIEQDTISLSEAPTGFADDPSGPWAAAVIDRWNAGWGITHIYAHGRWDGFAMKTSAYGNWPMSYVLTAAETSGSHASLTALSVAPGIVYSVACNQAAFDAEFALSAPAGQRCVAAELLANPDGGAVAFVGYSRWGWVYSSARVAQAFWTGVFDSSYTLGEASNLARLTYPYLRDVAYGHNVYGDPALRVWAGAPDHLRVSAPSSVSAAGGTIIAQAEIAGLAELPHYTLITAAGSTIASGVCDPDGRIAIGIPVVEPQALLLTVFTADRAPFQDTVLATMTVGVDDEAVLPQTLMLTNYPNPFNAATQIEISLPRPAIGELVIYNTLGREVFRWQPESVSSNYRITWDGRTNSDAPLPSGIYLARLSAMGNQSTTRRLLLLK